MKALAIFGGTVGFVIISFLSAIFSGWTLTVLWSWFVVPTFGLSELSIPAGIGIGGLIHFLTNDWREHPSDKKPFRERFAYAMATCITRPSFALLYGYIVHLFMVKP